jgi:RNase P subunit RPR2
MTRMGATWQSRVCPCPANGLRFVVKPYKGSLVMTTCERCGRELPDTLNFCPSCGTRLSPGGSSTYQARQSSANTFHNAAFSSSSIRVRATKNNTALVVEILLNLFLSLYGVGWLMAGAVRVGVILLIGSFFVYWPALIFGILFTFGLGIFSFGALALGLVILNAILLNKYLNRKAARRMGSRFP